MTNEEEFDFESRIVGTESLPSDYEVENSLRPKTLNDYTGQEKAKENLSVYIEAAKKRRKQNFVLSVDQH